MNLSHPIRTLVAGLNGHVLEVLAGTTRPLTGRAVGRLLTRPASQQGVQNALDGLAAQGLVDQVRAGRSILNSLNRHHVLAPVVLELASMRKKLMDELGSLAAEHLVAADEVMLFGSVARGEADESSDIDVLVVWADDQSRSAGDFVSAVERFTGNRCKVIEYSKTEYDALSVRSPALAAELATDSLPLISSGAHK